jgi:hypothetical protein
VSSSSELRISQIGRQFTSLLSSKLDAVFAETDGIFIDRTGSGSTYELLAADGVSTDAFRLRYCKDWSSGCSQFAYYDYSLDAKQSWATTASVSSGEVFSLVLGDQSNRVAGLKLLSDLTFTDGKPLELSKDLVIDGDGKTIANVGLLIKGAVDLTVKNLKISMDLSNSNSTAYTDSSIAAAVQVSVDASAKVVLDSITVETIGDPNGSSINSVMGIHGVYIEGAGTGNSVEVKDSTICLIDGVQMATAIYADTEYIDELTVVDNTLCADAKELEIDSASVDLDGIKIDGNENGAGDSNSLMTVDIELDMVVSASDFSLYTGVGTTNFASTDENTIKSAYPEIYDRIKAIKGDASNAIITFSGNITNQSGYTYLLVITFHDGDFDSAALNVTN